MWPWAWLPLFPSPGLRWAEDPAAGVVGVARAAPAVGEGWGRGWALPDPPPQGRVEGEGGLCSPPPPFQTPAPDSPGLPRTPAPGPGSPAEAQGVSGALIPERLSWPRKGALREVSLGARGCAAVHRGAEGGSVEARQGGSQWLRARLREASCPGRCPCPLRSFPERVPEPVSVRSRREGPVIQLSPSSGQTFGISWLARVAQST